jgi:phosphomannomutase
MLKFGTDGWRAVISDEFTFDNVRKVARAIALYLLNHSDVSRPLIVGYDPRFLADKFAEEIVKVAASAGINCLLTERDTPTPIVAWSVRDRKAAGAVMLTASHNPPQYCGIKFIPDYAGPADETITAQLQTNSNKEINLPASKKGSVERFEPREAYFTAIKKFVDVNLIRQAKIKVVYDPMYGCGRGYMDYLLQDCGCEVDVIHGHRDVLFGGHNPEPTDEELGVLKEKVVTTSAQIGLANDGDADRFGVVDEKGNFLGANQNIPLVLDYLVREKHYTGSAVRSIATTHLIDRVAALHEVKVHETPVGFKYIAQIMMKEAVIVGGEESGGLSIKGHIPEKDGLLANLLMVEMLAKYKKPLSAIWQDLIARAGAVFGARRKLEFSAQEKERFMEKLKQTPLSTVGGIKVQTVAKVDGVKLLLEDGSWVLARPSGTEPIIRIYAEAGSPAKAQAILEEVVKNG